ncbi:MAG: hypothetical protein M3Q82_04530 [Actinomycetota bacterium]|nr:hypothetical protein [Actinomycetota bacterium]
MASEDGFDPDRLLATLDAYAVEYVLVGGFAARVHGAIRRTNDVDCVPDTSTENLERVAAALRHVGARLRVSGMTDDEARQLPVIVDAETLVKFGNSTWMTDAGALDLLVDLRDEGGGRHLYADLASRTPHAIRWLASTCSSLRWATSSGRRCSPIGTRTARHCPSSGGYETTNATPERTPPGYSASAVGRRAAPGACDFGHTGLSVVYAQ